MSDQYYVLNTKYQLFQKIRLRVWAAIFERNRFVSRMYSRGGGINSMKTELSSWKNRSLVEELAYRHSVSVYLVDGSWDSQIMKTW